MPDGRWRVRYKMGTRERKRFFETQSAARDFIDSERKRIVALGRGALTLSPEQHARIMVALADISEGKSIAQGVRLIEKAVRDHLKHKDNRDMPSVSGAVEDLIEDWKKCKRNPTYISNGGGILRRFASAHSEKKISEITPRHVHDWLNGLDDADLKTPKARVSKLFAFSVMNGWVTTNFVKELSIERRERAAVEIPTYAEIESIMTDISTSGMFSGLTREYARRLFCGARRIEVENPSVREEDGFLIVPAGAAAKNGPARKLQLMDAYMEWEKWCNQQGFAKLSDTEFAKLDRAYRKNRNLKGAKKWRNWQRHSYASYRLPLLGNDLEGLATEMGNSVRVLLNNYLGNVLSADVPRFWALRPK